MELVGIENEAEFFPAGTLSDVLKEELKDITAQFSGLAKADHPVERLGRIAADYLVLLRRLRASRDPTQRLEHQREALHLLLTGLGYTLSRSTEVSALEEATLLPLLGKVADANGRDALWLLEALPASGEDEDSDPLSMTFWAAQFPADEQEQGETEAPIADILGDGIFRLREGPRHVLVCGASQLVLVDARKWPARSVLRFDLQEIFSREDADTLTVMACLVAKEARVTESGIPLSDRLEEEAQRNANAVTSSLKRTVRDAIEVLGQEVLDVTQGKYPSGPRRGVWIEGEDLSMECLRFMYRLLFLFYAEANPRLGILNLKDPVYASGYSLEALRELESIRLRTPVEREGTYLWESLQNTLGLLYQGDAAILRLPAVKNSLLDPASTPVVFPSWQDTFARGKWA